MPSILMKRLERDLKADAISVDVGALSAFGKASAPKKESGSHSRSRYIADSKTKAPFLSTLSLRNIY